MKKYIPESIKNCLWSYRSLNIDLVKEKEMIITQVLNYGTWDAVKWLFRIYNKKEIRNVIKKPQRGLWFKETLNFWSTMFNIKIPDYIKQKSLINLNPT